MADRAPRRERPLRRFAAAVVILAVVAVAGTVALASILFPPARAVSLTFERDGAAAEQAATAVEDRALAADRLLTSDRFRPHVTFRVRSLPSEALHGGEPEFCFKGSAENTIVFQHLMGCVDEVRLIHAAGVDCGGVIVRLDAASVAAAILARPDLSAVDRGPLDPGRNIRADLLATPTTGRVVDVITDDPILRGVPNPDGCRLLPPPGSEADPIEIRRDMTERYVLLDHPDGLVIVRAGTAGHDAASVRAGYERGYGYPGLEGVEHMLGSIYDIGLR